MKNPFNRSGYPYEGRRKATPEGVPLEGGGYSRPLVRIVVPIIIGIIIVSIIAVSSVRMVDASSRGVLIQFGNVYTESSLDEGLHFVVPFRDNIVQMEVRTQKVVEDAASASKDLQDVSTQVALNYHLNPDRVQIVYQQLGFDYASRVITNCVIITDVIKFVQTNKEKLMSNKEDGKRKESEESDESDYHENQSQLEEKRIRYQKDN